MRHIRWTLEELTGGARRNDAVSSRIYERIVAAVRLFSARNLRVAVGPDRTGASIIVNFTREMAKNTPRGGHLPISCAAVPFFHSRKKNAAESTAGPSRANWHSSCDNGAIPDSRAHRHRQALGRD
jgi:hypothetical protein